MGICMGIVWEAYHKGVPLLGVPGITLENINIEKTLNMTIKNPPLESMYLLLKMVGFSGQPCYTHENLVGGFNPFEKY